MRGKMKFERMRGFSFAFEKKIEFLRFKLD